MKTLVLSVALTLLVSPALAANYVHGYYRSNGTYVQGYYRSSPNNTVTDNYSFEGNSDPYTGTTGSNYDRHDETSPYFDGTPYSNGRYGHSGAVYGY